MCTSNTTREPIFVKVKGRVTACLPPEQHSTDDGAAARKKRSGPTSAAAAAAAVKHDGCWNGGW